MLKALVTGSNGQDGYYMCEYLLNKGYNVIGVDNSGLNDLPITQLNEDISDENRLSKILDEFNPDEIYNFGGNSDNAEAFDKPYNLLYCNTKPVITILDYLKKCKNCKLFQASSSLIFGDQQDKDKLQRIDTPKDPTTPYGASKLYAYNMIKTYRKHYNVFAINGILYNHESVRRKPHFLFPKIVKGAVDIKEGKTTIIELGNIKAERSWIHAKDVVEAAYNSLQTHWPVDYIICGDKLNTVQSIVDYVFKKLNIENYPVDFDNRDLRNIKQENNYLGDNSITKKILKWEPKYSVEDILDELIDYYSSK